MILNDHDIDNDQQKDLDKSDGNQNDLLDGDMVIPDIDDLEQACLLENENS